LKLQVPKFSAVFIGEGPEKSKIKQMIKHSSLEQNVTILDDITHDHMVKLLNSAKIFLSLTISDGTPLSLFEAIACGLYPVVSNITAYRVWFDKGIIGESLDFEKSEQMAQKIYNLIVKLDQLDFSENNRRVVREYMDFEKNSRILNNIFISHVK
jgi:glycosyltransferase involved in cell wall biosynthesis